MTSRYRGGGDTGGGQQKTKPIQHVEGLHSIRLGLNHRMLFTPDLEAGSLCVHHVVTRGDHDRVVKQLGR